MNIGNYDWKSCFYADLLPLIYSLTNEVTYKSKSRPILKKQCFTKQHFLAVSVVN